MRTWISTVEVLSRGGLLVIAIVLAVSGCTRNVAPSATASVLPSAHEPSTPSAAVGPKQDAPVPASDEYLRSRAREAGEKHEREHHAWVAPSVEEWRSAVEGYVPTVDPTRARALNAPTTFAPYLNGMHNRIHPIFADSFLESLDHLPPNHPMNDEHLITRLEIVLTKEGNLQKMGVVHTSGMTAFDIAALAAVQRASPFGPAPSAIISPDGNVYLHWEFHRGEVYACSTMNARPYLLAEPANP